ncbi:ribosyldihydronicotinamide dehydrogenase [quinone]-like [Nelusetta ayraudi]|uniref:ribosyldihydronicotinamide dehydrogenase [quinone]-like n=1 Tax=Nelusetta ayraudi TaxID=303726 RepID=UPI003F6E7053
MGTEVKRALIVYTHYSSNSFNAAAKDKAKKTLEEQGWKVEVSDLYAMKFKVTTTVEDIIDYTQEEDFQYADAAEKAWHDGKLSDDILKEQVKLKEADLVIFQFPMYWFSVPAILKGWMDRVLTKGFAYTDKQGFSEDLFSNTKVLLSFTTGSLDSMFRAQSINGDVKFTLCPILQATLRYCRFKVLKPQIFRSPSCATDEERKNMLTAWQKRLEEIENEKISQNASESGVSLKSPVTVNMLNALHKSRTGASIGPRRSL